MKLRHGLLLCLLLLLTSAVPLSAATAIYTNTLDSNPGWSATGGWTFGAPGGAGGDPASAHTGSYVYGNYLGSTYGYNMPAETLTTTAIDCSSSTGTTLTFWRWLGVELAAYDHAYVDVSGNGGSTWTRVWANPYVTITDSEWQLCSYDIANVADGQSDVRIRWTLGPSDGSVVYAGWNIDDIQIWSGAPTLVLAWTAYTDIDEEYANTVTALTSVLADCLVMPTSTLDANVLAADLKGKHVFLIPEQEQGTNDQLTSAGTAFSSVLESFVRAGGTLVDTGEWAAATGTLTATGLMSITPAAQHGTGDALSFPSDSSWHPIATTIGYPPTTSNATECYTVSANARVIATDASGYAAIAARDYGAGAVVALGWDFYEYDTGAATALAAAVRYPKKYKSILLYDDSPDYHRAAEALRRGGYDHYGPMTYLDSVIASRPYHLLVIDNPQMVGQNGDRATIGFVQGGGRSILSTWRLSGWPALAAAYGVSSVAPFYGSAGPDPLYNWGTTDLFAWPDAVPNLLSWDADSVPSGYIDGDLMTITDASGIAAAGYAASAAADEVGVAVTNDGATIVDGFLLWQSTQDADYDSVPDVVELVMNEITDLSLGPFVEVCNCTSETVVGTPFQVWGYSAPDVSSWVWAFDDGTSQSGSSNVYHTFTTPGFHTGTLYATNSTGTGAQTLGKRLAVGFADTPVGYWAFRQIIACYEASILSGYWDGYHPEETVTRAQMAVYMARARAGGDANVPAGPATADFADVPTDYWAYKYIEYCYASGIVTGYWDGYHPGETVNRAQMAVYVARALTGSDAAVPAGPATATFTDVPTDYWAFKYVEYCVAESIVAGYWDGYHPDESVTRAQMAVYIQRAYGLPMYN
jgi:hypothetical protein